MPYRIFIVGDWRLELEKTATQAEYEQAEDATITKAFELGRLPYQHCGFTASLSFAVPCEEIAEWGDLRLKSPVGDFVLPAQRARRGQPNGAVTISPGCVGFGGVASEDSDSPPVSAFGRFLEQPGGELWFQISSITYADGTHSGFLGCPIFTVRQKAVTQ